MPFFMFFVHLFMFFVPLLFCKPKTIVQNYYLMQLKLGNTLFPHTELINFCAYPFECKYCTKEIEAQKKQWTSTNVRKSFNWFYAKSIEYMRSFSSN